MIVIAIILKQRNMQNDAVCRHERTNKNEHKYMRARHGSREMPPSIAQIVG